MEHRFIDGAEASIVKAENNLVNITYADGRTESGLEPRRLLPVRDPGHYITLLDEEGVEHAVIRDISKLDAESRQVVEKSLGDYYLIPHITRILSYSEKYGTLRWTVETDRGIRSFDIRNRNHDIKTQRDGSIRVRDSDDNRYLIQDYRVLDKKSRAALISDI